MDIGLLQRAGLAIAIGLLIGIQRGWQEREAKDGSRVAGIRTFTLIAALGYACASLPGSVTLGLCAAAFALPFGMFEWRRAQESGTWSVTDFVAGLTTFALGAYAVQGNMALAAAGGVVVALILAERRLMHAFLRRLTWIELRAALLLLVMTVVLLPALPDRTIDPWKALNPHEIWLMTVLVGAVSYVGYIAQRLAGARKGLLFAGIAGGLVTSTTVTWTFARLARRDSNAVAEVMTAILAAWLVSLWRVLALATAIAPQLALPLAPPIAASSSLLFIAAALSYRAAGRTAGHALALQDPFELPLMIRFAGLLAAVMLLAKSVSTGQGSLLALGAFSGLLDVDPVTLSMAKMANGSLSHLVAATTILAAVAANGLAKSVLAVMFGGWRLGSRLAAMALLASGAGALAYFV